jgi:hypothetical protein
MACRSLEILDPTKWVHGRWSGYGVSSPTAAVELAMRESGNASEVGCNLEIPLLLSQQSIVIQYFCTGKILTAQGMHVGCSSALRRHTAHARCSPRCTVDVQYCLYNVWLKYSVIVQLFAPGFQSRAGTRLETATKRQPNSNKSWRFRQPAGSVASEIQIRCVAGQQPLEVRASPAGLSLSGGPESETADGVVERVGRAPVGGTTMCRVGWCCLFAAATGGRGVRGRRLLGVAAGCYTRRSALTGAHGVGRCSGSEGATAAARAPSEDEEVKAACLAARFT